MTAQHPATPETERCPDCRHAPHDSLGFCPNMASDNDCACTHGAPAAPETDVSAWREVAHAVIDLMPLDSTGHIAKCAWDDADESPRCGCMDLPQRVAEVIATATRERLRVVEGERDAETRRADALAEQWDDSGWLAPAEVESLTARAESACDCGHRECPGLTYGECPLPAAPDADAASEDVRAGLIQTLRPLLGAHADVTANHLLASEWWTEVTR